MYQNWMQKVMLCTMTMLASIITINTGNWEQSSGDTGSCSEPDTSTAHHRQQEATTMSQVSICNLHRDGPKHPAVFNIKLRHRKIPHHATAYMESLKVSSSVSLTIELKRFEFKRPHGTCPHLAVFCCCSAPLRWSLAVCLWQCCLLTGRSIL